MMVRSQTFIVGILLTSVACSKAKVPEFIPSGKGGDEVEVPTPPEEASGEATATEESIAAAVLANDPALVTQVKIGKGQEVATEETVKVLGLQVGIKAKGSSFQFSSADAPDASVFEFALPFMDGVTDNLVVVYRLAPKDNDPIVHGLIPLANIRFNNEKNLAVIRAQGFGEYQVAETSEPVLEQLPKRVPSPPSLTVSGSIDYTNFFGLESLDANHIAIIGDAGLRVINVANPAAPAQAAMVSNANGEFGAGRGIERSGNLLIQTTNQGGVGAFMVGNPQAPAFRGGIADSPGRDVTITGVYGLTATSRGVRAFTFATAMDLANRNDQTGGCNGIDSNNQLVVAACAGNVVAYATNTLPTLQPVMIDAMTGGAGVALAGNHAYVAGATGLRIYDVTDLAAPKLTSEVAIPGALQVAIRDDKYAVVLTATEAILVNIATKSEPRLYNPSVAVPVNGGRRARFHAPDKLVILDSVGVKVVTMKVGG